MVEGNGIDLGSIYGLLLEIAKTVNRHDQRFDELDARFDARFERIEMRLDRLEATVARKSDQSSLDELRQEVREYHAAVVGHGIQLSEHEERLGRIEVHLGLPHG